jgi:hypothetical protein
MFSEPSLNNSDGGTETILKFEFNFALCTAPSIRHSSRKTFRHSNIPAHQKDKHEVNPLTRPLRLVFRPVFTHL